MSIDAPESLPPDFGELPEGLDADQLDAFLGELDDLVADFVEDVVGGDYE